jgi:hypothetical protein
MGCLGISYCRCYRCVADAGLVIPSRALILASNAVCNITASQESLGARGSLSETHNKSRPSTSVSLSLVLFVCERVQDVAKLSMVPEALKQSI